MIELEAAVERILSAMPAAQDECIDLHQAHRRILAENVVSSMSLPAFDNSAVDGYAVRAEDVRGATGATPVSLQLVGRVEAGAVYPGEVTAGTCVRLFTGSPLPRGADSIAMQEDTRVETSQPDKVHFLDAVKPWENLRFQGEDIKPGTVLGKPGDALTAGRLSLLAAAGTAQVSVGRRPVLGLLTTGSELLEPGQPLVPGKIYESNRICLAALAASSGAIPKIYPLVKDTMAGTRAALDAAFRECDVVVTSGGVSVGEMDFVKGAFEGLGGKLEFWKIAIRPGRPFVFGSHGTKFLFGLPGNPVAAFVTFVLLVRPALLRWQGAAGKVSSRSGTLTESLSNSGNRRHFLRVTMDSTGQVRSAGSQNSHMLASLADANGLVDLPAQITLPAGTPVQVIHWD